MEAWVGLLCLGTVSSEDGKGRHNMEKDFGSQHALHTSLSIQ